tara:strand:- start:87 stop:404 length:318 start_codon:yes stop_codon:yes gene_type:complete
MDRLRNIEIKIDNSKKRRYFKHIKYPDIPKKIEDIYIITKDGDRLDNLAFQFYNDIGLWWVITISNPDKIKRDSLYIKPGLQIRIPTDIDPILEDFEKINEHKSF